METGTSKPKPVNRVLIAVGLVVPVLTLTFAVLNRCTDVRRFSMIPDETEQLAPYEGPTQEILYNEGLHTLRFDLPAAATLSKEEPEPGSSHRIDLDDDTRIFVGAGAKPTTRYSKRVHLVIGIYNTRNDENDILPKRFVKTENAVGYALYTHTVNEDGSPSELCRVSYVFVRDCSDLGKITVAVITPKTTVETDPRQFDGIATLINESVASAE